MENLNLRSHITDSRFYGQGYGTSESRQIFCDLRRMQRWLDIEVVLAKCQAELGIIPPEVIPPLTESASIEKIDLQAVKKGIMSTGHSLVPLLKEWQKVIGGNAGQYIHFGATTQDIQDTGQSLELRDVILIVERDLSEILKTLTTLTEEYRDVVMIGRTHGQHALPTTLGLKIASWLDETFRNYNRLQACKENLLVSQLFGGVGTMAALSGKAVSILNMFSARLGLHPPMLSWHSCRDRVAEFTSLMAMVSGGLARMSNEIYQLARDEIGELKEPFTPGQVGSTTMPHKQNPELCEQVVVLAKLVKANALTGFDTLINEHERDYRCVRLEWAAVAEASMNTCAALSFMKKILNGLTVNRARIKENLDRSAVMVSTEALMFLLAKKIGKQTAHDLIYLASIKCKNPSQLLDEILNFPEVSSHFAKDDLEVAVDPSSNTGLGNELIERLTSQTRQLTFTSDQQNLHHCPLTDSGKCCTLGST